jgi:hypothetical protein
MLLESRLPGISICGLGVSLAQRLNELHIGIMQYWSETTRPILLLLELPTALRCLPCRYPDALVRLLLGGYDACRE